MTRATVTELPRRLEEATRDPFIDRLAASGAEDGSLAPFSTPPNP